MSVATCIQGNNGVSKVLGILLSDFVSRGSEHSVWRHQGHENKQLKSAQCQRKANAVSGSQGWGTHTRYSYSQYSSTEFLEALLAANQKLYLKIVVNYPCLYPEMALVALTPGPRPTKIVQ